MVSLICILADATFRTGIRILRASRSVGLSCASYQIA